MTLTIKLNHFVRKGQQNQVRFSASEKYINYTRNLYENAKIMTVLEYAPRLYYLPSHILYFIQGFIEILQYKSFALNLR